MLFLQQERLSRAGVLVALISLSPLGQPAIAGPDHGHRTGAATIAPQSTGVPRITARSENYELVGSLKEGLLTVHLKRGPDGSPVTGAKIELTIDGETGAAVEEQDGTYTYQSAALMKSGEREVIVTITEGKKSDLLVGVLMAGQGHGGHAGHAEHDDHTSHSGDGSHAGHGHDDHGSEGQVRLTPEVMREFGITTERAGAGTIGNSITRPAEISFNMDRFTHVVPRVAGIAKSINVSQGDTVKSGQFLAVLESRELAELKAAYLAALERLELANDDFERVKILRRKNITSEKAFLTSRAAHAEARIAMRSAKQKLNSIGISDDVLAVIAKEPDSILTQYTLRAPMSGLVVRRHLVQGELVSSEREAFVIADVASVWVNISIYAGDLPNVSAGQDVRLETETGQRAEGTISFVTPDVSEQTRTATARVVLKGSSQIFRPGMFVKANIDIAKTKVALRIPTSALQTQDGREVVFALEDDVFKPRPVKVGRRNERYAEVTAGLTAGDIYAAEGAFLIKSQLSKASFGDGHNH